MIKLNETSSAQIHLLGEEELTHVVGGSCHRRGNYGHGGSSRRHEGGDDSRSGSSSSGNGNNVQIGDFNFTINIAQVQG